MVSSSEIINGFFLCVFYICISGGLITSNKYILTKGGFPFPMALSAIHMGMTTFLSACCYTILPSWYPSMNRAVEKRLTLMKFLIPIAFLFAASLYAGNRSYMYCGVAFLQFMKESNVAIVFILSCVVGLQGPTFKKFAVIVWIISGSSLCVRGELHFVLFGFLLQMTSQLCECSKNVLGEIVLTGNDLKLDALTMTLFQAPMTMIPLVLGMLHAEHGMLQPLVDHWHLILPNACLAFVLNITVAVIIKNLSTVSFVLCGLVKDIALVIASAYMFGDTIMPMQWVGFVLTIVGIALWSWMKIQESQAATRAKELQEDLEKKPLLSEAVKAKALY